MTDSHPSDDHDDAPRVSVVLPTLNEEDGIRECLRRIEEGLEAVDGDGEVVVSDSSTDRTAEIAREHGARVVEPDRSGYGAAYRYAFEHVRGDVVVMGDADTTYDFREIPRLLEPIEDGADLVVGSRFEGDIADGAMPWLHRYVGNPFLTRFLNLLYGMDITDAHSGFRAVDRPVLDEIEPETTGMEFASEMLVRASTAGVEVREVPISYGERVGEATIESFSDGWRHLRFMIVNTPGEFFVFPGIAILVAGLAVMAITLFDLPPLPMLSTNSMIAGSLLTVIGSNVLALGVFSGVAGDPIRSPSRLAGSDAVERLTPEHGMALGALLVAAGLVVAVALIGRWIGSGFVAVPDPTIGVLAMTPIALGVQLIFQMLFVSLLQDRGA